MATTRISRNEETEGEKMWVIRFMLKHDEREKLFYDLLNMRRFLVNGAHNPNFQLIEVRQIVG